VLQRATLGGVKGVVDIHFRTRDELDREWRGTFVFHAEDEPAIALMSETGTATFETLIEGERRSLAVNIVSFTHTGLAFFEAKESLTPSA
jgi:hypothetical protein